MCVCLRGCPRWEGVKGRTEELLASYLVAERLSRRRSGLHQIIPTGLGYCCSGCKCKLNGALSSFLLFVWNCLCV